MTVHGQNPGAASEAQVDVVTECSVHLSELMESEPLQVLPQPRQMCGDPGQVREE